MLIYPRVGVGIVVYEQRLESSHVIFPIPFALDIDFYWSPDRRSVLQVELDTQSPTEENAYIFTLYPDWYADPITITGRFNGYSTPRWSPDGQTVIMPACPQLGTGCGFFDFYRIARDNPQLEEIPYPELASIPDDWQWYDNHTLIIVDEREVVLLDLNTGESETLVSNLPIQLRGIHWTDDFSRMSYFVNDGNNFCLRVLIFAEGDSNEVVCGGLNRNHPVGWLDDGETLYYVRGDDDEIRLYDSVARVDQSATDPPTFLDWAFDLLYPLPQTPYLVHHATFNRQVIELINTETRQIEQVAFDVRGYSDADFVPSPDGSLIALRLRERGLLGLIRLDEVEAHWIESVVCCVMVWD